MKCDGVLPQDNEHAAVQDVRQRALQSRVAHQIGGFEDVSVQTQISLAGGFNLQPSDPHINPTV